jgi:hypothetical protein
LSRFVTELTLGGPVYDWLGPNFNITFALAVYMAAFGALLGLTTLWALARLEIKLSRLQAAIVFLAHATLLPLAMVTASVWEANGMTSWAWPILFAAYGLSVGVLLAAILRKNDPTFTRRQILLTTLGWTVAYFLGAYLDQILYWTLVESFETAQFMNLAAFTMEAGVVGLIGGLFLMAATKPERGFRVNWKTILAGTLGFGLGNLFANILVAPLEQTIPFGALLFLVWGMIGGAALAIPSKDYKSYLALGLLGGLGMMAGFLATETLGAPEGIREAIIGLALGLFLGFGTRKVPAALTLSLIGAMGYVIRYNLNGFYYSSDLSMAAPVEYTILALTAGLFGAMIGLAWSLLKTDTGAKAQQPAAK